MPVSDIREQQTVDSLYRQHHDWLKAWLYKRLACSATAADLAHDTFLRLITSRQVGQVQQPKAYLGNIARGLLIDRYRRHALEQAYLESLATLPEPLEISSEQRLMILETLLEIDRMLDGLSERTRTIFCMTQFDGLSYVQISQRLNLSTNTVRKHFIQALTQCLLLIED